MIKVNQTNKVKARLVGFHGLPGDKNSIYSSRCNSK